MAELRDITPEVLSKNAGDIPIVDTDFYKWVGEHHTSRCINWCSNAILTYLESEFNYIIGREKISERMLCSLKYIHGTYIHNVMKPLWQAEDKYKEDIGHA